MKLIKYKYLYTTIDLLSAFIAWNLIFAFYKSFILSNAFVNILPFWQQTTQLVSSILIPFFWIILYYLSGYYNNPLRKTLLEDVGNTIVQSLIGVCIIFIILFFLGSVGNFQGHFTLFFLILFIHITITVLFRMGLTSFIIRLKINRKISFRTLMI